MNMNKVKCLSKSSRANQVLNLNTIIPMPATPILHHCGYSGNGSRSGVRTILCFAHLLYLILKASHKNKFHAGFGYDICYGSRSFNYYMGTSYPNQLLQRKHYDTDRARIWTNHSHKSIVIMYIQFVYQWYNSTFNLALVAEEAPRQLLHCTLHGLGPNPSSVRQWFKQQQQQDCKINGPGASHKEVSPGTTNK